MSEREQFEAWECECGTREAALVRVGDSYTHDGLTWRWRAWQASRAGLPAASSPRAWEASGRYGGAPADEYASTEDAARAIYRERFKGEPERVVPLYSSPPAASAPAASGGEDMRREVDRIVSLTKCIHDPCGLPHDFPGPCGVDALSRLSARALPVSPVAPPAKDRFDCAACGRGVPADEDGCCASCGADCAVVKDGDYANLNTVDPVAPPARTAEEWARKFHSTYESLASKFGYTTRTDTRDFDPKSSNGMLMVAVCAALGLDKPPASEPDGGVERARMSRRLIESLAEQRTLEEDEAHWTSENEAEYHGRNDLDDVYDKIIQEARDILAAERAGEKGGA